ncbi:hypothetical protein DOY81_009539, partial [Sarcophaga bullata]
RTKRTQNTVKGNFEMKNKQKKKEKKESKKKRKYMSFYASRPSK